MSPLWLYAFTRPDAGADPALEGIAGAPVNTVDEGRIRAWCSPVVDGPATDRVPAVAAHHRVVQAAWRASSACVPARFGQRLPDEERLRAEIVERTPTLEPALDEVAGCVEMGIRIFAAEEGASKDPDEPEERAGEGPEPAGPGRAYLLERARAASRARSREARAHALAKEVEEVVVPFLRRGVVEVPRNGSGDAALAHLIPGGSLAAYRSAVHDWAHARSGTRAVVEGPWPPYSFADAGEGGAST